MDRIREQTVLIESDWNLKRFCHRFGKSCNVVLIESDWNLKETVVQYLFSSISVLIESDWNLKYIIPKPYDSENKGINRIRLEFKVAPFKAIHVFVSLY